MRSSRRPAKRRLLLLTSVTAALAVAAVTVPAALTSDRAEASAPLRAHAAAIDRYIGTSIDPDPLADEPIYGTIVAREFNSITTGNTLKWDWTQPSPGQWNFGAADTFVDFAEQHDQLVRGHTLVWHNQTPGWVQDLPSAQLRAAMESHIDAVVGRYEGRIGHWDVVNEPFEEDGSLRDSFWREGLGDGYIAEAFQLARQADPNAELYLNDYNVEGINAKSDAMYELVADLLAQGVPIDGVGLQGHLILGQVPSTLQQNIARFAALGVDVAITELDIRMQLPVTPGQLEQQARDYAEVVDACLAVERCVGLTVWSFTDRHSWIPEFFPGEGAALPWDEEYEPKPAYHAIHDALAAHDPSPPTGSPPTGSPPTASPTTEPPAGDCTADYQLGDEWPGGFVAEVTVTAGSSALTGWRVTWTFADGQGVSDHWNAIVTTSGPDVTAVNTSWNGNLDPGASTTFGFVGTHPGTNTVPAVTCTSQ
ncbi:endo-1,4-beta-xylanase [Natronosporangium hydrolyticum]|uniref:Beta-xylanase n=1 Tax=Natronosporangium hydrolyticum TaxID=2811111 RepID=A0A895YLH7_9ACTN|nr:endo-1,4-beta-xylanase [Natronosporangium hydrolyticum]QSB16832.1 endo-1,4-beta-xylanase [Natronosporangium hydrolyticum]